MGGIEALEKEPEQHRPAGGVFHPRPAVTNSSTAQALFRRRGLELQFRLVGQQGVEFRDELRHGFLRLPDNRRRPEHARKQDHITSQRWPDFCLRVGRGVNDLLGGSQPMREACSDIVPKVPRLNHPLRLIPSKTPHAHDSRPEFTPRCTRAEELAPCDEANRICNGHKVTRFL
jgi:hypothetical protein